VVAGFLSKEQARSHPLKNVVTRALGGESEILIDVRELEMVPGDLFMLCSDGLTSMVDDERILETVEKNRGDLRRTAKALISAANKRGGEDNITVVFFEIAEDHGEPLEKTATYPQLEGDGHTDDDTLDELDRVPAVETMIVPPGQAPAPAPEAGKKPRVRRRVVSALLLILVALAVVAIVLWTVRGR
jgi:hypothetical protein